MIFFKLVDLLIGSMKGYWFESEGEEVTELEDYSTLATEEAVLKL